MPFKFHDEVRMPGNWAAVGNLDGIAAAVDQGVSLTLITTEGTATRFFTALRAPGNFESESVKSAIADLMLEGLAGQTVLATGSVAEMDAIRQGIARQVQRRLRQQGCRTSGTRKALLATCFGVVGVAAGLALGAVLSMPLMMPPSPNLAGLQPALAGMGGMAGALPGQPGLKTPGPRAALPPSTYAGSAPSLNLNDLGPAPVRPQAPAPANALPPAPADASPVAPTASALPTPTAPLPHPETPPPAPVATPATGVPGPQAAAPAAPAAQSNPTAATPVSDTAQGDAATAAQEVAHMSPDQAQNLLAAMNAIKDAAAHGKPITDDMLAQLPPSIAATLRKAASPHPEAVAKNDTAHQMTALPPETMATARRDPYGIADIPEIDSWAATDGLIHLPLPGGGDIKATKDFATFGLKP